MKKIGITGYKGRVGQYLLNTYSNYVPLECDVTNPEQTESCIRTSQVDLVVHLAAKSNVEFCEKPENEKIVSDVNLRGTFNVCHAADLTNVGVLLLSSDHVFSGGWGRYRENHKPRPVNQYGLSKFSAESLWKVFDNLNIIRTSYLFDHQRLLENSIQPMLDGIPTLYPTFISRSFMHYKHFVQSLNYYVEHFENMPTILHISGSKVVSWYNFISEIARNYNVIDYKKLIVPRRNESHMYAPRPMWAGLHTGLSKKLGFPQYSYIDGIKVL